MAIVFMSKYISLILKRANVFNHNVGCLALPDTFYYLYKHPKELTEVEIMREERQCSTAVL